MWKIRVVVEEILQLMTEAFQMILKSINGSDVRSILLSANREFVFLISGDWNMLAKHSYKDGGLIRSCKCRPKTIWLSGIFLLSKFRWQCCGESFSGCIFAALNFYHFRIEFPIPEKEYHGHFLSRWYVCKKLNNAYEWINILIKLRAHTRIAYSNKVLRNFNQFIFNSNCIFTKKI